MIATRPFLVARRSFGTVIPPVKHDVMSSRWETRSEAVDRAGRRPARHRGRVCRPRAGARARGHGPRRDPSRDRRARLRDAAARRRGRHRRDPCRRDALLPDGRAPGPARGCGPVACGIAGRRDRSRERRRRDRRQAVPLLHGARDLWPGRRGDLPRSGLPDLRVGGSLLGRDAGAAAAPRGARLQLRSRRARGAAQRPHAPRDPQRATESDGRRHRAGRSGASCCSDRADSRLGAHGRGVLADHLRRRGTLDRVAAGAARAHRAPRRLLEDVRDDRAGGSATPPFRPSSSTR